MALHVRTIIEAIDLATAIFTDVQANPILTGAESAQIGENINRLTAVRGDVNPNTQLVPQNRRNADATALRDRVFASNVINDKYWIRDPAPMYDALDLTFDIALAIEEGRTFIESDLSAARP